MAAMSGLAGCGAAPSGDCAVAGDCEAGSLAGAITGTSVDPGPRRLTSNPNTPPAIAGASTSDQSLFNAAIAQFNQAFSVTGTFVTNVTSTPKTFPGSGLGPGFNSFSCRECHGSPAIGGSSFSSNGQASLATGISSDYGILAPNQVTPSFLKTVGPSLAARLKYNLDGTRDGSVHQIFNISGRSDAPGCQTPQVDWATQVANNNVSVRITTPTFGAGLVEAITDATILAGKNNPSTHAAKVSLGISGHENLQLDGTLGRFGWKAQTRTLNQFAADAFNHEMGVTSALFPAPNDPSTACNFKNGLDDKPVSTPNGPMLMTDFVAVAMRLSAPRAPIAFTTSALNGQSLFNSIGCPLCHTATMTTGSSPNPALANKTAALYSDLLVHHMGPGLADDVIQGTAGPDEFRSAPLWGIGQRYYFMHDGRTNDLKVAIAAHASPASQTFPASEANAVINNWNALSETQKQDLLNFLRSL